MTSSRHGGFTLIELIVALGILLGFLMFLVQVLSGGVSLFDEGERGQEVADLRQVAASAARACLEDLVGPTQDRFEPGPPDARLLVQWVGLGLREQQPATQVQALRGTVRIEPAVEEALLRRALLPRAEQAVGSRAEEAVAERLEALLAEEPRRGRAEMLLLPWPAGDEDGAFLELRRVLLLPGERIPIGRDEDIGLLEVERLDAGPLPAALVKALSERIAGGLLHFELELASQYTTSFDAAGDEGPEMVWDSARAGLLAAGDDPRQRFSLDLGQDSLQDTTDDVYPRRIRVTLVVARAGESALLAEDLAANERALRLLEPEVLPGLEQGTALKVGAEWLGHGGAAGAVISGLQRGQRGTAARGHPRGTRVRTGQTITFEVELAHGRDCWNG